MLQCSNTGNSAILHCCTAALPQFRGSHSYPAHTPRHPPPAGHAGRCRPLPQLPQLPDREGAVPCVAFPADTILHRPLRSIIRRLYYCSITTLHFFIQSSQSVVTLQTVNQQRSHRSTILL